MDLGEFRSTMQQIAPYAELTMLYFMGESTLHPRFIEILEIARSTLQGKIVLSTNAQALTVEETDAILAAVDLLVIPIDRWDPAAYERIRRNSIFSNVVSTAERFLERRGQSSSPQIVVKGLDIRLPRDSTRTDYGDEAERFQQYWNDRGAIPLAGWLNTWAGQMPGLLKLTATSAPYATVSRVPCADLWFKMVINWRGHVVLCCHNWNSSVTLGDVATTDVGMIWQDSLIQEYRQSHAAGNYDVGPICARCREWADPSEFEAYLRLDRDDLFSVF